jgi:hypothetical protein
MTPEKELEEIRKWLSSQDLNDLSFAIQIPVPRLRAFRNMDTIDPAYTTIRKLQNYKNGTVKLNA